MQIEQYDAITAAIMGEPITAPQDTLYVLYGGEVKLYFDADVHVYYRFDGAGNRVNVAGVTDSCHIIDKSDALCPWAAKKTVEHIADNFDYQKQYTPEELTTLLDAAKRAHREYKENASDIGKIAHDWIEQYIKAKIRFDELEAEYYFGNRPENPAAASCVTAAFDWMDKHKVRWLHAERKVYSRIHDYAGTVDGVGYMSSCGDRECCGRMVQDDNGAWNLVPLDFEDVLAVSDWKSSNALYDEHLYQTAAYASAVYEELGLACDYRSVNRLGKADGAFESWIRTPDQHSEDFETFLSCLDLSRKVRTRKAADKEYKALLRTHKKAEKDEEKARVKAEKDAVKAEAKRIKDEEKAAKAATKKPRKSPQVVQLPDMDLITAAVLG